jgi:hypothetical protein
MEAKAPRCRLPPLHRAMAAASSHSCGGGCWQVAEQQLQLTQGLARQGLAYPLGELLKVEATSHVVIAKPGHGLVAVGVGGPNLGLLTTARERSRSGHGAASRRHGYRLGRC